MATLRVGDPVADFELPDQDGRPVRLSTALQDGPVVLFFYPVALSGGCTTEACHFRDLATEFKEAGAQRLGISTDPVAKQKKFDDKYGLGFPLLSDEDHKVAEAWGVWGEKSLYGRKFMGIVRSAFVVDDKGKLKGVFYKVSPKDTVPKAEAALEEK